MIEKKHCEYCKKIFRPKRKITRFCSKPCSMRWHWNIHPDFRKRVSKSASDAKLGCTLSKSHAKAISDGHKKNGNTFTVRGGSGRGLTQPQQTLLEMLGNEWIAEFVIKTNIKAIHYTADLCNQKKKLIIECDGSSHGLLARKKFDLKRDKVLNKLGWKVLRLKNKDILLMCSELSSKSVRASLRKMFSSQPND